jgi:hypothetical protein
MLDIKINDQGEFVIENGDLVLIDEKEQVASYLKAKLGTIKGEWFLDVTKGLPYFENIFVKSPNLPVVEAIFKTAILEEDFVTELVKFNMTFNPIVSKLTIDFIANSIYGQVALTMEV